MPRRRFPRCLLHHTALDPLEPRTLLSTTLELAQNAVFGGPALDNKHLVDVATIDLNFDGLPDVVAASDKGVYTAINNGDHTFGSIRSYQQTRFIDHLIVADFNGDGVSDIALTRNYRSFASLRLMLGRGDGTFGASVETRLDSTSYFYTAINVDGVPGDEVVAINRDPMSQAYTLALYAVVNSQFSLSAATSVPSGALGIVGVGDVTGDGRADLVMRSQPSSVDPQTIVTLVGGSWTTGADPQILSFTGDWTAYRANLADIDGDGLADIILAQGVNGPYNILTAKCRGLTGPDGSLLFDAPVLVGTITAQSTNGYPVIDSMAAADANSDGQLDIIVNTTESTYYGYMNGSVENTYYTQLLSPNGPADQTPLHARSMRNARFIDLDNDGHLDAFGPDWEINQYYPYYLDEYILDAVVQWSTTDNQPPLLASTLDQTFTSYDAAGLAVFSFSASDQDTFRPTSDHLSIVRADFFADTNHNGRFDAKDQLIGQDLDPSDGFSLSLNPRQPWAERRTLVFARAIDGPGAMSDLASTSYTNPQPTVSFAPWLTGSFADHRSLTVFASVAGAPIQGVEFSLDSNRNGFWDTNDRILGADIDGADGWTLDIPLDQRWARTPKLLFAIAWDDLGRHSIPASIHYANPNPVIKSVSIVNPQPTLAVGQAVRFRVNGLTDPDAETVGDYIANVKYYVDLDHDGAVTSADLLLGRGRRPSQGYYLDATIARSWLSGRRRGTASILAVATDSSGNSTLHPASLVLNIGTA